MSSHVHSQTGTSADLARVGWDSEWAPEKRGYRERES
jgi:hypothetical protein